MGYNFSNLGYNSQTKMKRGLIFTDTKQMSHAEWLATRVDGIGGSDVGTILGLNPYLSRLELFYLKCGFVPYTEEQSLPAYTGTHMEKFIYDVFWKYWDPNYPTTERMIVNAMDCRTVRKARRVNAVVKDPELPWLIINIDFLIPGTHSGEFQGQGVLECKSALGYVIKQWESEIPPMYISQHQTYLLVLGLLWGELALLVDGRYPNIYPVQRSDAICNKIATETEIFWKLALDGKEILASKDMTLEQKEAELTKIEPPPDESPAYEAYMTKRYLDKQAKLGVIEGNDHALALAHKYLEKGSAVKELEEKQRGIKNLISNLII